MTKTPNYPAHEEDKFKKAPGRKAAEQENDTQYLDGEALEDDLVDPEIEFTDGEETSQEWPAREDQNQP